MDPADLERLVDRELRSLPPVRAPRTLLPRVLAAVHAKTRPWYSRAWLTWPLGWQIASLVVLLGTVAGGAMLAPAAQAAIGALPLVDDVRGGVANTTRDAEIVATALGVLWRMLLGPVVRYALAVVFLMCLACAVFGTALNHLVFGKALR